MTTRRLDQHVGLQRGGSRSSDHRQRLIGELGAARNLPRRESSLTSSLRARQRAVRIVLACHDSAALHKTPLGARLALLLTRALS